jgi:hypothetical protein
MIVINGVGYASLRRMAVGTSVACGYSGIFCAVLWINQSDHGIVLRGLTVATGAVAVMWAFGWIAGLGISALSLAGILQFFPPPHLTRDVDNGLIVPPIILSAVTVFLGFVVLSLQVRLPRLDNRLVFAHRSRVRSRAPAQTTAARRGKLVSHARQLLAFVSLIGLSIIGSVAVIASSSHILLAIWYVAFLLSPFWGAGIVGYLLQRRRQALARHADAIAEYDERPPVLYLRAFSSDEPDAWRNSRVIGAVNGGAIASEVAARLFKCGPVVALPGPGDSLPAYTLARIPVPSSTPWTVAVNSYFVRAQLIIIVLEGPDTSLSGGLAQEVQLAIEEPLVLQKTVFVVATPFRRTERMRQRFELHSLLAGRTATHKRLPNKLLDLLATKPVLVRFTHDGEPVVFLGSSNVDAIGTAIDHYVIGTWPQCVERWHKWLGRLRVAQQHPTVEQH